MMDEKKRRVVKKMLKRFCEDSKPVVLKRLQGLLITIFNIYNKVYALKIKHSCEQYAFCKETLKCLNLKP